MAWKTLKRKVLIDKSIPTLDTIYKQTATKIKQANLQKNCQSSIDHMQETSRAMSEFFLKTLDKDCEQYSGAFSRKQMADQRLYWNVKNAKLDADIMMQGPVADLIGKHMRNSIKFDTESVDDKQHYFNNRFNRGDFQITRPQYTQKDLQNWKLPKFMKAQVKHIQFEEQQKLFLLDKINSALNNINIAIALEEDLKQKVNLVGSRGIIATGEFEMRRAMIAAYYDQACEDFKTAFGEKYYQQMLLAHTSKDMNALAGINQGVGRKNLQRKLASKDLQQVIGDDSIFETAITDTLAQVGKHQLETQKAQQSIQEYIDDENELIGIQSFNLDSNEFLFNMAYLAAQNPSVAEKINKRFESIASSLQDNSSEKNRFKERVAFYRKNQSKLARIYHTHKQGIVIGATKASSFSGNSFELHVNHPFEETILKHKGKIKPKGQDVFSKLVDALNEAKQKGWIKAVEINNITRYQINFSKLSNLDEMKSMRNQMAKIATALDNMRKEVNDDENLEMGLTKLHGHVDGTKTQLEDVLVANGINEFALDNVSNQQYQFREQQYKQTVFDIRNEISQVTQKSQMQQKLLKTQLHEQQLKMEEMQYELNQELVKTKNQTSIISKKLDISIQTNDDLTTKVENQEKTILRLKTKISTFVKRSNESSKSIMKGLLLAKKRITKLSQNVDKKLEEVRRLISTSKNADLKSLHLGLIELQKVRTELKETLDELSDQIATIYLQAVSNKELVDDVDEDVALEVQELLTNINEQKSLLTQQQKSLNEASKAVDSLKSQITQLEKIIRSKNERIGFLQYKNQFSRVKDFTSQFKLLDAQSRKSIGVFSSSREPKAKFIASFIQQLLGSAVEKKDLAKIEQTIKQSEMARFSRHGSTFFNSSSNTVSNSRRNAGKTDKRNELTKQTMGERMLSIVNSLGKGDSEINFNELYAELRSGKGFVYRDYTVKLVIPGDRNYQGQQYAIALYKGDKKVASYLGDTKQPYNYDAYVRSTKDTVIENNREETMSFI